MTLPAPRFIWLLLGLASLCVALGVARLFIPALSDAGWLMALLALALLAAATGDLLQSGHARAVTLTRSHASNLALGKKTTVTLTLTNPAHHPVKVAVFDHYPAQVQVLGRQAAPLVLPAAGSATLRYAVKPVIRGDAEFSASDLLCDSRWGLWQFKRQVRAPSGVKIYPDFASILRVAGLAFDQKAAQLGIHLQQRRGEGKAFRQLREFRHGDSLRGVDWKATSRTQKLIARDYQDERDQEIVFLLDTGRRLHSQDGELSHFDLCLNAVILLAYVALNKGDKVGLASFAGTDYWLPARAGHNALARLLRQVYGIHSSLEAPDYLSAASRLLQQQKRRALVVLISNFNGEESDELLAAVQLLKRRHQVLAASLREPFIDAALHDNITSLDDALIYAGTCEYMAARNRLLARLRAGGIYLVDCLPNNLANELVGQYMAMKKAGVI